MSTSPLDSRNSKYIAKANLFRKVDIIQVYVEDEDIEDNAFWRFFLQPYEKPHNVKFKISTLRDKQKTLVGKCSLLSKFDDEKLGKNLWLCIDSDYDDLIKGYTVFSERITKNKYIITTWWYSIENLKCQPELLTNNLLKVTLSDIQEDDISKVMNDLGQKLKIPFILLLVMREQHDDRYTMSDFKQLLSSIRFKEGMIDDAILSDLLSIWNLQNSDCITQYSQNIQKWEGKLSRLGFSSEDYFQLYNGHHLLDYVAISLLKDKADRLRTQQKSNISNGADAADRKQTLLKEYDNKTCRGLSVHQRIEQLINDNNQFPESSATKKIRQQIEEALR